MTRKDLETFDPKKLRPGRSWSTMVVRPDGYHECHYFFRDKDGELFTIVGKNHRRCTEEREAWQAIKRAKVQDLKQLSMLPVIGPGQVSESHSQESKIQ